MFYFTMLDYIFGIDCQTTLQVQEKRISRLPVEIHVQLIYVVIVVSGYWASCPDTEQHRSSAKILISRWKKRQKKPNCLSSFLRLNRFSLGQISEFLRLAKESYCNVKLKCPDTGQHTVRLAGSHF